ncbi:MAG TPA: MopE-related protein, partial [Sandaracinaceae bacterium LLY-WYZ-13_1]|nr:MopE-related protein [Sandaracinaceae bacterium LLY-WYZ-13_1]
MQLRWLGPIVIAAALVGCGDDPVGVDAGTNEDAAVDGGPEVTVCARTADCDDGVFCNGQELCRPGEPGAGEDGCLAGEAPCTGSQTCNEMEARCDSDCAAEPDADGDGHDAVNCGGDDCDDADPEVFAGAEERCDDTGRDEDCDPATLSGPDETDADADGYVAAACCNRQPTGALRCGLDCDDEQSAANPGFPETCDEIDNDCDDMIDERVRTTYYRDGDEDLYGDDADTMQACMQPDGYTANGGDCDDADGDVNPGAEETCNDADDDCDENVDEEVSPAPATPEHCGGCGLACPAGYGCDGTMCVDAAVEVDAGSDVICVRTHSGAVHCWGLGDWPSERTVVSGVSGATSLSVGGGQGCAVVRGGDVACWGQEPIGGAFRSAATSIAIAETAMQVAVGDEHACALVSAGDVYCWGRNDQGQLGVVGGDRSSPVMVGALGSVDEIAAGRAHTCARSGTDVQCWGDNARGQLGDGMTSDSWSPVMASVIGADLVAVGGDTSCAGDGSGLACWGSNRTGQTGSPPSGSAQTSPADVALLTATMDLADSARIVCPAGVGLPPIRRGHGCALASTGRVFCWGDNTFGALGDGTTASHYQATQIPGLTGVVDVGLGAANGPSAVGPSTVCATLSCAALGDGTVECWGANPDSILQTGDTTPTVTSPSTVIGFPLE